MQQATVIKVYTSGMADVSVKRANSCSGNCANCLGCGSEIIVPVQNHIHAKVGDTVLLKSSFPRFLFLAFFTYIFPVLVLFTGYYVLSPFDEQIRITGCICAFILSLLALIPLNHFVKKISHTAYSIYRISN